MTDLYAELSELDKKRIDNYLSEWGSPQHRISAEEYLSYWVKNKQKFYKLLGNKLIYTHDFVYTKPIEEIRFEFEKLSNAGVDANPISRFIVNFRHCLDWIENYYRNLWKVTYHHPELKIFTTLSYDFLSNENLAKNYMPESIKERTRGKERELRLQKGGKLLKAVAKIMEYYREEIEKWQKTFSKDGIDLFKCFEEFRIAHSVVLNDKVVRGTLSISIHPLDFMTMSDNGNKWSSCMSWQENGCYRSGTVEMMNSNNVICCYISSDKTQFPFHYRHYDGTLLNDYNGKKQKVKEKEPEEWLWNSKKWRQLIYITKDIIVGGKAYPFQNGGITKKIIKIIKDLAEKNLGWTYSFGPELYKDMLHINSGETLERARWYRQVSPKKHNILFNTNAMYNDFICDYPKLEYWCYRNKVKKTQIITTSGPSKCLCCGGPLLEDNPEYPDYEYDSVERYHDRFFRTSSLVCSNCIDEYYTCTRCDCSDGGYTYEKVNVNGEEMILCDECIEDLHYCPGCGKMFFINHGKRLLAFKDEVTPEKVYKYEIEHRYMSPKEREQHQDEAIYLQGCSECLNRVFGNGWTRISDLPEDFKEKLAKLEGHEVTLPSWWSCNSTKIQGNMDITGELSKFASFKLLSYRKLKK